jgi:hypothetical protein
MSTWEQRRWWVQNRALDLAKQSGRAPVTLVQDENPVLGHAYRRASLLSRKRVKVGTARKVGTGWTIGKLQFEVAKGGSLVEGTEPQARSAVLTQVNKFRHWEPATVGGKGPLCGGIVAVKASEFGPDLCVTGSRLVNEEWERAAEIIHEMFDAEPGWA